MKKKTRSEADNDFNQPIARLSVVIDSSNPHANVNIFSRSSQILASTQPNHFS